MTTEFGPVLDILAAMAETTPEALAEAARDLTALQEPGWRALGSTSADSAVASEIDRAEENRRARWLYYRDPIPAQAVHLHNAYTFGRGVGFKAPDPDIQTWLQKFWRDPRNQHSLSRAQAQHILNRDRQLDGELFFALYTSTLTGRVTLRTFDPAEIPDNGVVTMPGDRTFPIYYKRVYVPEVFDFTQGRYVQGSAVTEYLPDWRNAGPHPSAVRWPPSTEVHVMHVLTNPLAGRGLTHLAQGLPWIKAFRGFMEDRVTLTLALATFAFVQKVKGNRQALQRLIDQWGQYETALRYGIGDQRERRQGGNTLIQNEAASLEQLKTDSGAANAYTDGRMLKQNAGIGSGGIFEHYFGDPSTGNLATATAMELPMLKMFEFEQQVWEDILEDLFDFVLIQGLRYGQDALRGKANVEVDHAGGSPMWVVEPLDGVDLSVEVTLPPIVQSDVAVQMTALASLASAEQMTGQQLVPPREKALKALQVLGFDDAGEIVADMETNGFQLPVRPAPSPEAASSQDSEAVGTALGEAFVRKLRAAADEPPDVGEPLDKTDGEQVEKITRAEVDEYFDAFAELPELDDLLKKLGLTKEDVEEAAGSAGPAISAGRAGVPNGTPGKADVEEAAGVASATPGKDGAEEAPGVSNETPGDGQHA